jgi:hypothetical protein
LQATIETITCLQTDKQMNRFIPASQSSQRSKGWELSETISMVFPEVVISPLLSSTLLPPLVFALVS